MVLGLTFRIGYGAFSEGLRALFFRRKVGVCFPSLQPNSKRGVYETNMYEQTIQYQILAFLVSHLSKLTIAYATHFPSTPLPSSLYKSKSKNIARMQNGRRHRGYLHYKTGHKNKNEENC
jgi:hypothetical protein